MLSHHSTTFPSWPRSCQQTPPPGWQLLSPAIEWHSLGRLFDLPALVPPVLACLRAAKLIRDLVERRQPALVLLKGPSEVSLAALLPLAGRPFPTIYHLSLDWLGAVDDAARSTAARRFVTPYFHLLKRYRRLWLRCALPVAGTVATVCHDQANALRHLSRRMAIMRQTFTRTTADIDVDPSPLASRRKRFLFVKRLDANKNVACLLKAAADVARQCRHACEVVICGDGDDREQLEQLARTLRISECVVFLGYVPQSRLRSIYKEALALVLPSFSEMFPQVMVEAYAAGTPVIASPINGVKDMLEDGKNGCFIDPYDWRTLAARMRWFLEVSVEEYEAMQRSAIRTAHGLTREAALVAWRNAIEEAMSAV